jgi:hypothetical protein
MKAHEILWILDDCANNCSFPMLDNGYFYLAATRLGLFRAPLSGPLADWALVIETFGFSPRAGVPDTSIYTFASQLHDRDPEKSYKNKSAYQNYLKNNPHNEFRTVSPVDFEASIDADDQEFIGYGASTVMVRGLEVAVPPDSAFVNQGIDLAEWPRIQVFELCRYFAGTAREQVLAAPREQRVSILPEMHRILQLEEWHHPDLAADERPSQTETFRQLAEVLVTGDRTLYRPTRPPNTHWSNWPEGGTL